MNRRIYESVTNCNQLKLVSPGHKGTFDVNDLMNNSIGALVGGVIAVVVMACYKEQK